MDLTLATLLRRDGRRFQPLRQLLRAMLMRRSRVRLAELDDHLLQDIGLDRLAARREAERPSWDAPDRWLQ